MQGHKQADGLHHDEITKAPVVTSEMASCIFCQDDCGMMKV
jgi:hypothetical protein